MSALETIKKIPMEIVVLLASNLKLQQLLVSSSNDPDSWMNTYDINTLLSQEYISFTPVVDQNISTNNKNTFVIVNLDEIDFSRQDNNLLATGVIFIGTDKQHAVLKNNKLRLLEMIDEIFQTLDRKKLSTSGEINMQYATFVSYSEYVFGYKITFNIAEQESRKVEI